MAAFGRFLPLVTGNYGSNAARSEQLHSTNWSPSASSGSTIDVTSISFKCADRTHCSQIEGMITPAMKAQTLDLTKYGDCLPDEDRSFGGNDFYVDTLPASAWHKNLRTSMSPAHWKAISQYVRDRAGGKCEICSSERRPEAHERWSFDASTKTQKLARIMCLCKLCHLGTHWGLTGNIGFAEEVGAHIREVTGWTKEVFSSHLRERKAQRPSELNWILDLSMMEAIGIKLVDPSSVADRQRRNLAAATKNTSIEFCGIPLDLSRELRKGYVALVAVTDEDCLGGVVLSNSLMTPYVAKLPQDIADDKTVRIPLALFIEAHHNPVVVQDSQDLIRHLADRGVPKRLVPAPDFDWIEPDLAMVAACLRDTILFSDEY